MDKLVLSIPKLQGAISVSDQATQRTHEIEQSSLKANNALTTRDIWDGVAASAYKSKADQWSKNFKSHRDTVDQMKKAMKNMYQQASALNEQALGFSSQVGGSSGHGTKNILTYDPNARISAIKACDNAIKQIDAQLAQLSKVGSALSGLSGFMVVSDITTHRQKLNNIRARLNKLRQAISKYATDAENLVSKANAAFGGINLPKEAIVTLQSWGMSFDDICVMLKGLNMGCCEYGGDPVNLATGNFVYEKEYLKIRGLFPLSFKMFYNVQEKRIDALGPGWVHNFAVHLKEAEQTVTLFLEDGREEIFFKNDDGTYTQNFCKHDTLKKTSRGYVYQNAQNLSYLFDENGKNIKISNLNGNYADLTYEQGQLIHVENNSGGALTYQYSTDGNLTQVSDHTERTVCLAYSDGRLSEVIGEEGQKQGYQYNDKGKICEIINPLGIYMLKNEYDGDNRVSRQTFPDGGVIQHKHRPETKELVMTEQNGNEIIYVHDDRLRSTAAIYADGAERYAYNEQNQRTWQIDKNGNETYYEYDNQGNVSKVTNALGEIVCAEYSKFRKPISVSLCGVERMTAKYDSKGNLLQTRDALGRIRTLAYNENGRPIRLSQPDGSEIALSYDERGNIVSVTDETSAKTLYEYDRSNRVVTAIDPNGHKTCFVYNLRDDIVKVINAENRERIYEYNQVGKLTKVTDFDSSVSQYEYNALNKPVRFADPAGQETRLEYDVMWNVTKQINANGAETRFDYDTLHRLTKVTNALGSSVHYAYDPNGNRTVITDPQGGQVHLSYDALNRVVGVIEADGASTGVAYNEMGKVTAVTDAMGHVRTFAYDAVGQRIEETNPLGHKTTYSYSPLGRISQIIDPAGRITSFEYAPGGLLNKEMYPDGRWISYEYDAAKNLAAKQDQSGYTLRYTYDCLNRIVNISSNQGQEKFYTYDAADHVTSMTDANGNTTLYAYSPNGKLTQVIDALGNKSEYDYGCMGQLIQVKQYGSIDEELTEALSLNESNSQLRVTTYHRNLLGQIERIEDALGQQEMYSYDAFGRVTGKTDKDGYLTQYAYGQNRQLESIQYADSKSVRLSYNPLRQLTEIQDWLGLTSIETDPLGRAKKVRDHNGKEVQYLFGAGGERLETVYPDGKKAAYLYDDALRLTQLVDGENIVSYAYDENSRLSEKRFFNGMHTSYEYNDMGLLSGLTHSDQDGVLDQYKYQYDLMGNKTGIDKFRRGLETDSGQFGYGYDTLGRLSDVFKDGAPLRSYAYDAFGNRGLMTEGTEQTAYHYNALNQLLRAEGTGLTKDYRYDARGNLTEVLENGLTAHTYEFGALNRLTKATDASGQVAEYEYNGLGFRVGESVADVGLNPLKQIDYVLDLTKQYHNVLQRTENGQTKSYAWDFNVVAESGGEGDRFYLQDELGSPLRFVGADGTLVNSYAYDEFGDDMIGNQGTAQPFGYTGYRYDGLARTYFAQAREYDPWAGRFTARDMLKGNIANPFSLNEYTYCWNEPLRLADKNGKAPTPSDNEYPGNESGEVKALYIDWEESWNHFTKNVWEPLADAVIEAVASKEFWKELGRTLVDEGIPTLLDFFEPGAGTLFSILNLDPDDGDTYNIISLIPYVSLLLKPNKSADELIESFAQKLKEASPEEYDFWLEVLRTEYGKDMYKKILDGLEAKGFDVPCH